MARKRAAQRTALDRICRQLLVVLTIQESRDVDRIALVARLVLVDLRLWRAAGDVRHALEQGAAGGRGLLRLILVRGRRNRCRSDGAGKEIVGSEQKLITAFFL